MQDHRGLERKKTFLAAYAHCGPGRDAVPCLVRDLSQRGARIMVAGAESLPETFDLQINGRDWMLRVRPVWRTATEMGVSLVGKVPLRTLESEPRAVRAAS